MNVFIEIFYTTSISVLISSVFTIVGWVFPSGSFKSAFRRFAISRVWAIREAGRKSRISLCCIVSFIINKAQPKRFEIAYSTWKIIKMRQFEDENEFLPFFVLPNSHQAWSVFEFAWYRFQLDTFSPSNNACGNFSWNFGKILFHRGEDYKKILIEGDSHRLLYRQFSVLYYVRGTSPSIFCSMSLKLNYKLLYCVWKML